MQQFLSHFHKGCRMTNFNRTLKITDDKKFFLCKLISFTLHMHVQCICIAFVAGYVYVEYGGRLTICSTRKINQSVSDTLIIASKKFNNGNIHSILYDYCTSLSVIWCVMEHWKAILTKAKGHNQYCFSVHHNTSYCI